MVSDSELVERLWEMLRDADLSTTSTSSLRRSLEEEFGVDLSDRKAFVREQVNLFFSEFDVPQQEEDPDEVEPQEMEYEVAGGEGSGGENGKAGEEEAEEENGHSSGSWKKKLRISLTLQELVGASELARTEVVRRVWAYILENNLQDQNNKRNILCDERLEKIFDVNSIDMLEMNEALAKHMWPLNSKGGENQTEQAAMVSDSELVERLREMLRDADLNTTSTASLRRCLEGEFGVDLSGRKAFVREQVDLFFSEFADKADSEEVAVPQAEEDPEEDPDEVEPQEMEGKVAGGEGSGEEDDEGGEEDDEGGEEDDDDDEEEEVKVEYGDSSGSPKKLRSLSVKLILHHASRETSTYSSQEEEDSDEGPDEVEAQESGGEDDEGGEEDDDDYDEEESKEEYMGIVVAPRRSFENAAAPCFA